MATPKLNVETVSDTIEETNDDVAIEFTLTSVPGIKFNKIFHIISDDLDVILLGELFLISEEAQIDYREATLRIANKLLYLDQLNNSFAESPDASFIKKTQHLSAKEQLTSKERDLLSGFAVQNHALDTILNYKMLIELTHIILQGLFIY